MFKTLLINQLNTKDTGIRRKIFFLIGDMDDVQDKLLMVFNDKKSPYYGKVTFKYNGMSIILRTEEIPEVISKLVEMGIKVYSVYELYEPI